MSNANPIEDLTKLIDEFKRVTGGMLEGKMSRDDALFAATAACLKLAIHLHTFVAYAVPILNQIELMMADAKRVAMEAQQKTTSQPAQEPSASAPASPTQPPNGQPIQVVDGTPVNPNGAGQP